MQGRDTAPLPALPKTDKGDDPELIRNFLQRVMAGRYGSDQLNLCLLVIYLILYLLTLVTRVAVFSWVGLVVLLVGLLRMMSRNIDRRRAENAKFMKLVRPVTQWLRMRRTIHQDTEHCYFKCPNCKQYLRVPKGKGKITITCRSCGASFQEKT